MTSSKITNVVFAGLGGQGVLKASDILAEAAFRAGLDVKKSEIHGMSQRGGFVSSDVRFGEKVFSPMISRGEADFLVLLEPTQRQAAEGVLSSAGLFLTAESVMVENLPSKKTLNVALLGMLSVHLEKDVPKNLLLEVILESVPEKTRSLNEQAFEMGRRKEEVNG